MTTNPPRLVTFDVMSEDPDWYFVLTTALGDFAASARAEAKDGSTQQLTSGGLRQPRTRSTHRDRAGNGPEV